MACSFDEAFELAYRVAGDRDLCCEAISMRELPIEDRSGCRRPPSTAPGAVASATDYVWMSTNRMASCSLFSLPRERSKAQHSYGEPSLLNGGLWRSIDRSSSSICRAHTSRQ